MHVSPTTDPNPLSRLWAEARGFLKHMTVMFGAPATLVALTHLEWTLRRALAPWVRSLEELVRKLLLTEAAQLSKASAAPWRPPIAKRPAFLARTRSGAQIAPSTPLLARFNLVIPRDERYVSDNRAPRIRALWDEACAAPAKSETAPAKRAHRNRLALRFAALQRMIEKPEAYVRRLAARLARIARDQRPRAALRFACRGSDHIAPGFGDCLRDAGRLVYACAPALSDSS
ncbi:MAG: hypothetical protein QM759_13790 [Terricaulis sp.]